MSVIMDWLKDWGPLATAAFSAGGAVVAATATFKAASAARDAVNVAKRVGRTQRDFMERQLQQNLFDRKFAVYMAIGDFVMKAQHHVLSNKDEPIETFSTDYLALREHADVAKFLLGTQAQAYLNEIQTLCTRMLVDLRMKKRREKLGQNTMTIEQKMLDLSSEILKLLEKRDSVFGPELRVAALTADTQD